MKALKLLVIGLFVLPSFIAAQSVGVVNYNLAPSSKLWLDGSSTLHDFTCNATKLNAEFKAASEFTSFISNPDKENFNIKVTIPVNNLKSGKESMDENMLEAFNAEKYPNISYEIKKAESKPAPESGEGWYKLETKGDLTISGVKKTVDMTVLAYEDNGSIHFKGNKQLKMSEFGIDPPTMMFGTIKTDDNITINFDLIFKGK